MWIIAVAMVFTGMTSGQPMDVPSYHLVEIRLPDQDDLSTLRQLGFDFESAHNVKSNSIRLIIREDRLQLLDENELRYTILQEKMGSQYAKRAKETRRIELPDEFGYGSLAGFYTFDEMIAWLDTLHMLYPDIVSEKNSIGTTIEGRKLWAVKISDNCEEDEDEPEVLYTGLHHAREPVSMMSVLYFMHWLTSNYPSEPDAACLVNEREMWFIPCVNPDGYVYNQKFYEDSNGKTLGMWRKNKRDNNGNGIFEWMEDGVDLNRNYGNHWGPEYTGSSGDPGAETYRGESAFSERETSAVRDFVLSHSFRAALNYHTFGDLMIYPFGYQPGTYPPEPDYSVFRDLARRMTDYNGYHQGTGPDILYVTNGGSDDWMYEGTPNQTIFAMTPEVGSADDGFWPPPDRLIPLVRETLHQNKLLAFAAGAYPQSDIVTIEAPGEYPMPGDTILIQIPVVNRGLESTTPDFQMTIRNLGNVASFRDSTFYVGEIAGHTSDTLVFPAVVNSYTMNGQPCQLEIRSTDGPFAHIDTMEFRLGVPLFYDNAENGMGNWNTAHWGIANWSYDDSHSFTDSPEGQYSDFSEEAISLNRSLDFSGVIDPELHFSMYCATEADYDIAQVQISTDSVNWSSLAGEYTRPGSGAGAQEPGEYGYDGQRGWINEQIDLNDYTGEKEVYLRLVMKADEGGRGDGIYFDDFIVYGTEQPEEPLVFVTPESFNFELPLGSWDELQLTVINQGADTLHYSIREEVSAVVDEEHTLPTLPQNNGLLGVLRVLAREVVQSELRTAFQEVPDELHRVPGTLASETIIQDSVGEKFGEQPGILQPDIRSVTIETDTVSTGQRTMIDIHLQAPVTDTLIGFISLDTDQNHGTGSYPAAFGFLPGSVSIGSEYEVIVLPEGLRFSGNSVTDSSLYIPDGSALVVDMSDTSIAGIGSCAMPEPDLVQITLLPGTDSLEMDGSRFNLAVSCLTGSLTDTNVTGIPDFAPNIGHGTYGKELGASWLAVAPASGHVLPNSQSYVRLPVVASTTQDSLSANLYLTSNSAQRDSIAVPVNLSVVPKPEAYITVPRSVVSDTLVPGYRMHSIIEISNAGAGGLTFFVADTAGEDWLKVIPQAGSVEEQMTRSIQLVYSPDSTADSTHFHGNIFIASTSITDNLLSIPVELVIGYGEVAYRGDMNRDEKILSDDVALLKSMILSPGTPSAYQHWAGDVNRDGQLDVRDIVALLNSMSSELQIFDPEIE